MNQFLLFPEIVRHVHLVADSPKKAFYCLWLEVHQDIYCVRKISGIGNRPMDRRHWCFDSPEDAEKRYQTLLAAKTDPDRKSPRKYKELHRNIC